MHSDYNKWFVCPDGAIKCQQDSFEDYCKKIFGRDWYNKYILFHRASFEEHCRFELIINE